MLNKLWISFPWLAWLYWSHNALIPYKTLNIYVAATLSSVCEHMSFKVIAARELARAASYSAGVRPFLRVDFDVTAQMFHAAEALTALWLGA